MDSADTKTSLILKIFVGFIASIYLAVMIYCSVSISEWEFVLHNDRFGSLKSLDKFAAIMCCETLAVIILVAVCFSKKFKPVEVWILIGLVVTGTIPIAIIMMMSNPHMQGAADIMRNLNETLPYYGKIDEVTKGWNDLQTKMKCCGARHMSDWYSLNKDRTLPESCCDKLNFLGECTAEVSHDISCFRQTRNKINIFNLVIFILNMIKLTMTIIIMLVIAVAHLKDKMLEEE